MKFVKRHWVLSSGYHIRLLTERSGFKFRPWQKDPLKFLLHLCLLAHPTLNEYTNCTLSVQRDRALVGHPPAYAKAKKTEVVNT